MKELRTHWFLLYFLIGLICATRNVWPLPSSAAARERSGSILMKPAKSPTPTPVSIFSYMCVYAAPLELGGFFLYNLSLFFSISPYYELKEKRGNQRNKGNKDINK